MTPIYIPDFFVRPFFTELNTSTPWLSVAETRDECFMNLVSTDTLSYTYGSGRGVRTYTSILPTEIVGALAHEVNDYLWQTYGEFSSPVTGGEMNVCFLNRYNDLSSSLGWHADDHPGTDHTRPICVLSFGQAREIWIRPNGSTGVVPPENRFLLGSGSLFIMPPGMQQTHQHRIPKGDRVMGPRISLTFRKFL